MKYYIFLLLIFPKKYIKNGRKHCSRLNFIMSSINIFELIEIDITAFNYKKELRNYA